MKFTAPSKAVVDRDDVQSSNAEKASMPAWLAVFFPEGSGDFTDPGVDLAKHVIDTDSAFADFCRRHDAKEPVDADAFCEQHPHRGSSLRKMIGAQLLMVVQAEEWEKEEEAIFPKPGEVFLGFQLNRELGRGGFARVFLATELALGNRSVAVKISREGAAEANTLGRISHPNIVPVYSVHNDPDTGLTAVCMPFLGSVTLCDVLDRVNSAAAGVRPPTIVDLAEGVAVTADVPAGLLAEFPVRGGGFVDGIRLMGAELADALQFIHEHGIYHRDLKPQNVLITADGRPMLLDFNLSADALAAEARVGGTLPYMSPEQLLATARNTNSASAMLDARSDVYSLGVMLYELLAGRHPFVPLSPELKPNEVQGVLLARQQRGPDPIRRLNPEVDRKLASVVERCLAYNPVDRPQRAADLADALRRAQSPVRQARRWVASHRKLTIMVASLVLAFAGAATAWGSLRKPDQDRHWREGRQAYQEHKYADAVKHFTAMLAVEPQRVEVLLAMARAHIKLGESDARHYQEALADLRLAEDQQPSGEIRAARGYCFLRLNLVTENARHEFAEAIKAGFTLPEVRNNLAYCLLLQGNYDDAEKLLDTALDQPLKLQAALHNRAMARFFQFGKLGGLVPPTRRQPKPPGAEQTEKQWRFMLKQAKDEMLKAVNIGPASMEWNYNATRIWAASAAYVPADAKDALDYLESTVAMGFDPKLFENDRLLLNPLTGDLRYKALVKSTAPTQPMPPTVRIVNPLRD